MVNWTPGASKKILLRRAQLLQQIREFFAQRGILEVETPCLVSHPTIDRNSDSFEIDSGVDKKYLITSPEYQMKRLLAAGVGSIYQICKCFRSGELGKLHNPEFTMIEWYRTSWDHWQLMGEVDELLQKLLRTTPAKVASYKDIFLEKLELNPFHFSTTEFSDICQKYALKPPASILSNSDAELDQLDFLMSTLLEPQLGIDTPLIIEGFPSSQSNLAQNNPIDPHKSCRFEVYYQGVELGNGYFELRDAKEQKRRLLAENKYRQKMGKNIFTPDPKLQAALESGLQKCAGVAMGFDRLLLLAEGKSSLAEVQSFSWDKL